MKTYAKPAPIAPSGKPLCVRTETDWTHAWTVADCIRHFVAVPRVIIDLFGVTKNVSVAAVWQNLTLMERSQLDAEFTYYDIRTGRV